MGGSMGQGAADACGCAPAQTCTPHGCLAERRVHAWVVQTEDSGFGGLSARGWPTPPISSTDVLVSDGTCSVFEALVAPMPDNLPVALDAGSASLQVNDGVVYPLPPLVDGSTTLYELSLSASGVDTLHAFATGGADVPEGSISFEMAPDVDILPLAPLSPGASWTLDWTETAPVPIAILEFFLDDTYRVWCQADGATEVTVPASITAMLPPAADDVYAFRLILVGELEEEPMADSIVFSGQAQRWKSIDVSVAPSP
jgi:hypothetical protein